MKDFSKPKTAEQIFRFWSQIIGNLHAGSIFCGKFLREMWIASRKLKLCELSYKRMEIFFQISGESKLVPGWSQFLASQKWLKS